MNTAKHKLTSSIIIPAGLALLLISALTCPAAPQLSSVPRSPLRPGQTVTVPYLTNAAANYLVRVEWKETNGATRALEVLTGEGTFQVNSSLPGAVKLGDTEHQISVTLNGQLKVLNSSQGQLQLFLGRSVPFLLNQSSIQQRQEGLTVTIFVTFGKPIIVQKDANAEISVSVKQQEP